MEFSSNWRGGGGRRLVENATFFSNPSLRKVIKEKAEKGEKVHNFLGPDLLGMAKSQKGLLFNVT